MADDLAHEIKNPLHSMVINLEVLKRRIARAELAGGPDMLRYTDVLASELERVSQRVDLLLRMVRPGRGGELGLLHEVIDELRDLIEVEAVRRSVRLQCEPFGGGGRLTVPREAARQVILNLVLTVLDTLAPGDVLHLVVEPAEREVRVRVTGTPTSEDPPAVPAELGRDAAGLGASESRFAVARQISESIGGRVELLPLQDSLSILFLLPAS